MKTGVLGLVAGALVLAACGSATPESGPVPSRESGGAKPPASAPPSSWGDGSGAATPTGESSTLPGSTAARPVARTAPDGFDLPCPIKSDPFDFDPKAPDYTPVNAYWMMWTALRSFRSDLPETKAELATLGFDRYADWNVPSTGLQAFVAGGKDAILIAFRGSTELRDWIGNFTFFQESGGLHGASGKVHKGFADALAPSWSAIAAAVASFRTSGQPIFLTGHSLGGAMATLAAARLTHAGTPVAALYTFAAPRAGNAEFAEDVFQMLRGRHVRFINDLDLVPHLPPSGEAAHEAARILQIEFAQKAGETLVRDLDYKHGGRSFRFAALGVLDPEPPLSENEDVDYWRGQADVSSGGRILQLVSANAQQAERHSEKTYMCKMQAIYELLRPAAVPH